MKKIVMSVGLFISLCCVSCSDPVKEKQMKSYQQFDSLFPEKEIPINFESGKSISGTGHRFERNDSLYSGFLPQVIKENGGEVFGKVIRKGSPFVLYIALADGDGKMPVFFTIQEDGKFIEFKNGFTDPGQEPGFFSLERANVTDEGDVFLYDSTVTWKVNDQGKEDTSSYEVNVKWFRYDVFTGGKFHGQEKGNSESYKLSE